MSMTAAAVGLSGAAMGRDTRSRRQLTARRREHSAEQARERWETATDQSLAPVDAEHCHLAQQAGTDSAQRRRRNRAHLARAG